ncbi:VMO1 protein, partial [Bucco capensis]|nr:VMO1 protein [Bucco capensis]
VALLALGVPSQGWREGDSSTEISVDNGGSWGVWGDVDFCPKGTYANGFQLKVEPPKGFFGDDTALNGIRLLCQGQGTAASSQGHRGSWSYPQSCAPGQRVSSFRLRVEAPRGLWDDTAANNLDVTCGDGSVLEGEGGLAGTWGNWSQPCPRPGGVCGLRTLVEPHQRGGDDTALNSVIFFCC